MLVLRVVIRACSDQNTVAPLPFVVKGGALGAGPLPVGLLSGGPCETGREVGGATAAAKLVLFRCFSTIM